MTNSTCTHPLLRSVLVLLLLWRQHYSHIHGHVPNLGNVSKEIAVGIYCSSCVPVVF